MPTTDTELHLVSYIPGDSENSTFDSAGDPLWSATPHFFPDNTWIHPLETFLFDLDLEFTSNPMFDNWGTGDMVTRDELPTMSDVRETIDPKYEENGGKSGKRYRILNGIDVTVESDGSGNITSYDFSFEGDARPSVLEQEDINDIKDNIDAGGDLELSGGYRPRYYQTSIENIDGVDTFRCSTIFGGYSQVGSEVANLFEGKEPHDFITNTLDWEVRGIGSISNLFIEEFTNAVGSFLFDSLLKDVPNIYHFVEFFVTADSEKYIRLWDTSTFPEHSIYLDGGRKIESKMNWGASQFLNTNFLAFFYEANHGKTPYHMPHRFYLSEIEKGRRPVDINRAQAFHERTVSFLPEVEEGDTQNYNEIIGTPPLALYGESSSGEISEDAIRDFLPDNPMNPFVNTIDHSGRQ